MPSFALPGFAKLVKKVERAESELRNLAVHAASSRDSILAEEWAATGAAASGVHNIYNGIEDILWNIARDVDGNVPEGQAAHQDLLDQMAVEIRGVRQPLLTDAMHQDLTELKGFRHLVRHRYGIELSGPKVLENVDLISRVLPSFVEALTELDRSLAAELDERGPGDRPSL